MIHSIVMKVMTATHVAVMAVWHAPLQMPPVRANDNDESMYDVT